MARSVPRCVKSKSWRYNVDFAGKCQLFLWKDMAYVEFDYWDLFNYVHWMD